MSYLLQRITPTNNERRFYLVTVQPTLLDDLAVVRTWGRIGGWSRSLAAPVADEAEALRLAERWVAAKVKRGYVIVEPKEATDDPT